MVEIVEAVGICGRKHSIGIIRRNHPLLLLAAESHSDMRRWIRHLRRAAQITTASPDKDNNAADEESIVRTMEAILDATVITDHLVRIIGFNEAAERMFGFAREEILGKSVNCLMPEMYSKFHDKYVQRYIATDDKRFIGVPRSILALRKDGTSFPVVLSLGEARCATGQKRYVAVFRVEGNGNGGDGSGSGSKSDNGVAKSEAKTQLEATVDKPYAHSATVDSNNNLDNLDNMAKGHGVDTVSTDSSHVLKRSESSYTSTDSSFMSVADNLSTSSFGSLPLRTDQMKKEDEGHENAINLDLSRSTMPPMPILLHQDATLPTLDALKDFVLTSQAQLIERMTNSFENLKQQVSEEYQVMTRQFERMFRMTSLIEEESSRMQREIEERDSEIARLRAEIDNLRRTSDRYNLLQVLNNESTYSFFLDFCKQRDCSEAVYFWREATDFKRKHTGQLVPTDSARREALAIYEKYLDQSSPFEVNISHEIRLFVKDMLDNPAPGMFDTVCDELLSSLNYDVFSQWILTNMGKACLGRLALSA